MIKVLVLCTGNSCRSIMAEGLINQLGRGRIQAVSAGSHPAGFVHPLAIETLRRHGIKPPSRRSKSWDEFSGQDFDYVITVCDAAAAESCPAFIGKCKRLHWSTPDPAKVQGTDAEIWRAFEAAFDQLEGNVRDFVAHV